MMTDNNRFYIITKKFNEEGCIAYKCKNLNEARSIPNGLEAIRADDLCEFMNQAGNLNLAV